MEEKDRFSGTEADSGFSGNSVSDGNDLEELEEVEEVEELEEIPTLEEIDETGKEIVLDDPEEEKSEEELAELKMVEEFENAVIPPKPEEVIDELIDLEPLEEVEAVSEETSESGSGQKKSSMDPDLFEEPSLEINHNRDFNGPETNIADSFEIEFPDAAEFSIPSGKTE